MINNNLNDNYEQLMNYALRLYYRDSEEDNNGLIAVYEEYFQDYLKSVDCINFKGQYEKIFEPFIQRASNSSSRLLKIYAYANKGYFLNCIGDYPKAIEFNEKALELCEKEFKKDNIVKINVMSNLADGYANNIDIDNPYLFNQFEKALKLRKKVLSFRRRTFGEKHPETISIMADVADSYRWVGNFIEAVKFGRKVLSLYKTVLGETNPYTIYARMNLSSYLYGLAEDNKRKEVYEEILELDEETLELSKNVFGENNPDTIDAMITVANDLTFLGIDEERADDLNRKVTEYFSEMENDYSSEE